MMDVDEFLSHLSDRDRQKLKTLEKNQCMKVKLGDDEATVCRLDDKRYKIIEVTRIKPESLEFTIHNLDSVPARQEW